MLVFSGLTVYHPTFKSRFPKNGLTVMSYAYPIMATGTILLTAGMMICSSIVEQSTEEKTWGLAGKKQNELKDLKVRILWLQKKHVVGDQSFDSSVIFAGGSRKHIWSSRRSPRQRKWHSWPLVKINKVASNSDGPLHYWGSLLHW
jgi:hypothetical protein